MRTCDLKQNVIGICLLLGIWFVYSLPVLADNVQTSVIILKGDVGDEETPLIHATKIEASVDNKLLLLDFACNMGTTQIEVVNANGTAIYSAQHQVSAGQSLTINLSQASAGAYTLRINDADGSNVYGDFNIVNENTN